MQLRNVVGLLCACLFFSSAQAAERISPEGKWVFDDTIHIPSLLDPFDPGSEVIQLPANIFVPTDSDPAATYPAIIFISSWALDEYEYLDEAQKFADDGYVVLSYTARGFHASPGLINTAGEADVNDARNAIDYLLDPANHLPVDPNRIGMGGVSYGAGISLLTSLQDERIKAVTAMSGWGDLIESLWAGNTPNETWIDLLITASKPIPYVIRNRPDPMIEHYYSNMKIHQDIEVTKEWGYIRSPIKYLPLANARENKPALFLSNNMHDYLFQPDSAVRMLSQYQGEWRMMLNRGTHASAEASALLGGDKNRIWRNVHLWMDHYLQDKDNGIDTRKRVNTVVLNTLEWESYAGFPAHDTNAVFNLNPAAGTHRGSLDAEPAISDEQVLSYDTTDHIAFGGWITGALNHTSRTLDLNDVDDSHGLIFTTQTLVSPMHLRGEAKVKFHAYTKDKSQYFAYLFFLYPETGEAHWVSHAPFSCHQSEGCGLNPSEPEEITLDFYWTSVDLPAGAQVMLVLDGKDPDYWRYDGTPDENTIIISPEHPATLDMPLVATPATYDNPVVADAADTSRSANGEGQAGSHSAGSLGWLILLPGLLLPLRRRSR